MLTQGGGDEGLESFVIFIQFCALGKCVAFHLFYHVGKGE